MLFRQKFCQFQSIATGYGKSSNLKYQTDYVLLTNACVFLDRTKKGNTEERDHIYQAATFTANYGLDDDSPYEAVWGDLSL